MRIYRHLGLIGLGLTLTACGAAAPTVSQGSATDAAVVPTVVQGPTVVATLTAVAERTPTATVVADGVPVGVPPSPSGQRPVMYFVDSPH